MGKKESEIRIRDNSLRLRVIERPRKRKQIKIMGDLDTKWVCVSYREKRDR